MFPFQPPLLLTVKTTLCDLSVAGELADIVSPDWRQEVDDLKILPAQVEDPKNA